MIIAQFISIYRFIVRYGGSGFTVNFVYTTLGLALIFHVRLSDSTVDAHTENMQCVHLESQLISVRFHFRGNNH